MHKTQQNSAASVERQLYRVLIVDDHHILRDGLAAFLSSEDDVEVVGHAENGQQAIELCRQLAPDVVLMDVSMPVMNGIDAPRIITQQQPAVRVIVLSMFEQQTMERRAKEAGAEEFLSKSESSDELMIAIRRRGSTPQSQVTHPCRRSAGPK